MSSMRAAKLEVELMLHGCRSLKDKRQRLSRLRDRFGRQSTVAVCESAHQDSHQLGHWTFVACGTSPQVIEQSLTDIERYVALSLDAEVIGMQRTWLS
ncbi:MAG: DUF503 domain-containing protein [Pseudomonadota bacterium]